jgi:hypothetical protein
MLASSVAGAGVYPDPHDFLPDLHPTLIGMHNTHEKMRLLEQILYISQYTAKKKLTSATYTVCAFV